jgi:hypothetical protein
MHMGGGMPRRKLENRQRLNTTVSTLTVKLLDLLATRWGVDRGNALDRLVLEAARAERLGDPDDTDAQPVAA